MRFRSFLTVALLCGVPAVSSLAAETLRLSADEVCVSSLKGEGHLKGGIATGPLADKVMVQLCDGSVGRLVFGEQGLELTGVVENPLPAPAVEPVHRIPDGDVTLGQKGIRSAWLTGPTRRYAHAVLGDAIEASGFGLVTDSGEERQFELGPESVFEDLRVRLIDLNGDGQDELVVIRSYLEAGAALSVYGLEGGRIAALGETPAIGIPNRWLNPAGAADFDGDGEIEIAYVETPHIGGMLRFFSLTPKGMVQERALQGFSNHAIGSRELDMAAVIDWNGDGVPDLALPDASRNRVQIVSSAGGEARVIARVPEDGGRHAARITTAVLASDLDGDGAPELLYGLSDGSLVITRP